MKRPTLKELIEEYQDFKSEQRFGQYLYNKYFSDEEPWPDLFYEEDSDTAFALVVNLLVEEMEMPEVINYTDDEIPGTTKS